MPDHNNRVNEKQTVPGKTVGAPLEEKQLEKYTTRQEEEQAVNEGQEAQTAGFGKDNSGRVKQEMYDATSRKDRDT